MKKVLIITRYFKRKEDIGSVRMRGLAKYLPEFGWEPTVLTAQSNSSEEQTCRVVETPFEDLTAKWKRRLGLRTDSTVKNQLGLKTLKNKKTATDLIMRLWEELFSYPDNFITWLGPAVKEGSVLLQNEDFDAILSSSAPMTTHLIANEMKERSGIPWIADLRDLWVQNHYYPHWWFRKMRERGLEIRTLSSADALTTVSDPLAQRLAELHEGKTIVSIPNGYDPEIMNQGTPLRKDFGMIYAGILYQGRRDPGLLFRAISEMISEGRIEGKDVAVDFYGEHEEWLNEDVSRYRLQDIVRVHDEISKEEVLRRERESQLLLLLMWDHPEERGNYTGKVFEYLAAQRPILSWGRRDGVVADLLQRTGAGVNVASYDDLKKQLLDFYTEFKSNGSVSYHGKRSEIEKYSHREMARKFSEVLEGISM